MVLYDKITGKKEKLKNWTDTQVLISTLPFLPRFSSPERPANKFPSLTTHPLPYPAVQSTRYP